MIKALVFGGIAFMVVSWSTVEKHPKRYSIERDQREQMDAAWRRFCRYYHMNRDRMENIDMDIVCFKHREMVP